jgi:hypothetical protein
MDVNTDKQMVTTQSGKKQTLTDQQQQLVDLLTTTSWPKTKIADEMGVNTGWVYQAIRKPHVKEALQQAIGDALLDGAASAIVKVKELVQHKSGYVALEASKDLLDRAGFKPVDRSQVAVAGDVKISIDLGG